MGKTFLRDVLLRCGERLGRLHLVSYLDGATLGWRRNLMLPGARSSWKSRNIVDVRIRSGNEDKNSVSVWLGVELTRLYDALGLEVGSGTRVWCG